MLMLWICIHIQMLCIKCVHFTGAETAHQTWGGGGGMNPGQPKYLLSKDECIYVVVLLIFTYFLWYFAQGVGRCLR